MAPSLARLLNAAPEFATGDPQEPLQPLTRDDDTGDSVYQCWNCGVVVAYGTPHACDTEPLPQTSLPEPARECVELTQTAAVDACHAALRAMLARLGRGDRHGS